MTQKAAATAPADISAKQRLLDAAQRAMLSKGYKATSVDEICELAGLTKGSFFHYFQSKEDLTLQLLGYFYERAAQRMAAVIESSPDPLERLYTYLDAVSALASDPSTPKSCLLGTLAQELAETNPTIRDACRHCFNDWTARLAQLLADAKAQYAPSSNFDPQSLASYFIAGLEGSLILGKARQDAHIAQENLIHFRQYLEILLPAPRPRSAGSRKPSPQHPAP